MGRRAILVVATMLALLAVGGVALAATIEGTNGNDRIVGSDGRDQIAGKGGHDTIYGLRARDSLSGGSGNDTIYAGPVNEAAQDAVAGGYGDDVIRVANRPAGQDVVDCGPGFDRVVVDRRDVVSGCNRVISR